MRSVTDIVTLHGVQCSVSDEVICRRSCVLDPVDERVGRLDLAALQHVIMQVPRCAVPSSTQKSNIGSSVVEFRPFHLRS